MATDRRWPRPTPHLTRGLPRRRDAGVFQRWARVAAANRHVNPPVFRGDCFDWFPTFIEASFFGTYRLACCCSYSAGGTPPSEVCRRSLLNQATYSTRASSSWVRVRQTRSRINSVLKLSTKLSAVALS